MAVRNRPCTIGTTRCWGPSNGGCRCIDSALGAPLRTVAGVNLRWLHPFWADQGSRTRISVETAQCRCRRRRDLLQYVRVEQAAVGGLYRVPKRNSLRRIRQQTVRPRVPLVQPTADVWIEEPAIFASHIVSTADDAGPAAVWTRSKREIPLGTS